MSRYHDAVGLHHASSVADVWRGQWRLPMVEERGQHVWDLEVPVESEVASR